VGTIPVFYSDELLAESDTRSPSASKPRPVVEGWLAAGMPIEVHPIIPATYEDLCLAHDPAFGELDNGFDNRRRDVARSLPYTSGAMVCAAQYALHSGLACAPVSGFHHAGYATASMFCTFNGLMVAALRMLALKQFRRVLILDCDFHYGNGTDGIIEHLKVGGQVENATFGRWYCAPAQAARYLEHLERVIATFEDYGLVLYQAGADLHVDDPLGGVLDTEQLRIRDRMVFEGAKTARRPVAWCLAGGYQEPISKVVALHLNTMRECARVFTTA
jgi:acetoin utilization deacetylase AcuC-like enzyme